MNEWPWTTLGDVSDILVGYAFKSASFTDAPADIRLLRGVNIGQGHIDWDHCARWPTDDAFLERYELRDGDVVLAMDRPWVQAGLKRARVRPKDLPAALVQRVARLRGTPRALTSFIHHVVATEAFSQYLRSIVTGATVPHISQSQIESFKLRLPPMEQQRTICDVLDSTDELIENNRRRVEVLEEMARATYREWFVHLRYPGHEDAAFVDSALGPIPEGWEVRPLHDVAALVRGRSYRKHELVEEGGLPFINLKCMMRGGGFRREGLKRYEGRYTEDQLTGHGDIVLAVTDLTQEREILARATLVPRLVEGAGVISLDVVRVVPSDPTERLWIYAALRWSDFARRVKEYANGSTVLHLSPVHVADGHILWPPRDLRSRFVEMAAPTLASVDELYDSSDRLADIRDLLLPKLVTGQIDLSSLDQTTLAEGAVV